MAEHRFVLRADGATWERWEAIRYAHRCPSMQRWIHEAISRGLSADGGVADTSRAAHEARAEALHWKREAVRWALLARLDAGSTAGEVAEAVDVDGAIISRVHTGTGSVSDEVLDALVGELGVEAPQRVKNEPKLRPRS